MAHAGTVPVSREGPGIALPACFSLPAGGSVDMPLRVLQVSRGAGIVPALERRDKIEPGPLGRSDGLEAR